MATVETVATPPSLAFGATFRAAFGTVFAQLGPFLKAAAVPLLISSGLIVVDFSLRASATVGALPLAPDGGAAMLLEMVIGLLMVLPSAFLGIMLTQLSVLGRPPGFLPRPLLGRRTWVVAGYQLLLSAVFILLAAGAFFAWIALLQALPLTEDAAAGTAILGGVLVFCVLLYLVLRLSLVLPATALDARLGLGGSWRLTRRGGMKLLGVFLLLILVNLLAIIIGSTLVGSGEIRIGTPQLILPEGTSTRSDWIAIVLANMPRNLWNLVVNFIAIAMGYGALASAYKQLSGWDSPRQDILERFE